jgi:hypothetical protein
MLDNGSYLGHRGAPFSMSQMRTSLLMVFSSLVTMYDSNIPLKYELCFERSKSEKKTF